MSEKSARDAMLDAVLEQIDRGDPPEARDTYDRLIDGGHSNREALELMAEALREEMEAVLVESTPFDNERYARRLAGIPTQAG